MNEINRIVNIRIKVYKYMFDAAIDCNWTLHAYSQNIEEQQLEVPIELYNLTEDWDINVIYCAAKDIEFFDSKDNTAYINFPNSICCHTFISEQFIRKEIKKWIAENNKWYGFWYRLFYLFKPL